MDFGPGDRSRQMGGTDSNVRSNGRSALKVSFDARGFVDSLPTANPGEVAEWSKAALC
jgi:hypothetical protein